MLNILIPLSGSNTFKVNDNKSFPRILNDVGGKLLIERAAAPFIKLGLSKNIIVALPKNEAEKYQLDKVIGLLGPEVRTCEINGNTKGAACSALLAIESLDLDSPLIISSFEQVLDFDLAPYVKTFIDEQVDAGVLTFEAIHPKWSFVKTDRNGYVTQAAEKMPISKEAVAGLFYYKTAKLFIEAAKSMIRKDIKTNDSFYISPTLNEIILKEGIVKAIPIDKSKYFHINDEHSLDAFETKVADENDCFKEKIKSSTCEYVDAFNRKDLNKISKMLSSEITLVENNASTVGADNVITILRDLFGQASNFSFV
ncbi:hypothetical protein J3L11_18725, partial [Shewanella sp. 4t3-1-2LB]|uniref:hypothetical protein n=1 Tax=Shewanella sp. 4t3-1-2LB TaxID=2817682 RepID=UPI001A98004E